MSDETFPGRCSCGFVRFRMNAAPMFVHGCHCRWCQRQSGSAFAINALVETGRVEVLEGEVEAVDLPTPSGAGQRVLRCPKCRIALWSHYLRLGTKVAFVRVGTLEAPDRFPPDVHIHTVSKQPWVRLPDGVPAVPAYYDAKDLWPAGSLARRDALMRPAP